MNSNPIYQVQVLNRDLSIRMITLFARQRAREQACPKGNRAKRRAAAKATTNTNTSQDSTSASAAAEVEVSAEPRAVESSNETGGASSGGGGGSGGGAGIEVANMSAAELDAKLRSEASTSGIRILDALAATGLRSIRYFKEIPGVKQVTT